MDWTQATQSSVGVPSCSAHSDWQVYSRALRDHCSQVAESKVSADLAASVQMLSVLAYCHITLQYIHT